jgi:hypothetical protein
MNTFDCGGPRPRRRAMFAGLIVLGAVVACGSSGNGPGGGKDASTEDGGGADTGTEDTGADTGIPQCASNQSCVGYPSFGDWICLESCSGPDAGDCPSGMTCTSVSGCCTGTGCSAVSHFVCVASPSDGGPDGQPDGRGPDGGGPDGGRPDVDAGLPQCGAQQSCVGYPSFGDWVCLDSCAGPDAGDCPSGTICTSASGCCTGTACAAVRRFVCVAPVSDAGAD